MSSTFINNALAQGGITNRSLEPVIIKGNSLHGFLGTPLQQIFVYSYSNGNWHQVPSQIDEISQGSYVSTDDGLLSNDDEVVLMAGDLGEKYSGSLIISGSLLIEPQWYEVEVTDPTTNERGWAYLFQSKTLSQTNTTDYADFDLTMQRIIAKDYEIGLAASHAGIDYLTLNGGDDILDRFKLRASVRFGLLEFPPISENDLGNPEANLIKDGPIRVLFNQIAERDVTIGISTNEVSVKNTYLAYAGMMQTSAASSFTLTQSGVSLESVRTSFDLNKNASGSKFYNGNTDVTGVTIDGIADSVNTTPASPWSQISHSSGRMIQITDASLVGGTQTNYYCDDAGATTEECDASTKTGDDVSYGDFGYSISGDINRFSVVTNTLFILSAADVTENVGELYNSYIEHPLIITLRASPALNDSDQMIFLPILVK